MKGKTLLRGAPPPHVIKNFSLLHLSIRDEIRAVTNYNLSKSKGLQMKQF